MNKSDRVIVIGLDSFDVDLLDIWVKEGRLPFLKSLIKSGVWTRLISTRGLFSDSPWPSFNTGVSPARHSFYNFLQLDRGTTNFVRLSGKHCKYLPFWWLLRESRKKVAVFDIPKTYPLKGIDGKQITAWGEHYPLLESSSLPVELMHELISRFGKYFHPYEIVNAKRISQEVRLHKRILSNIELKYESTKFLMAQEDWDLFITVFSECHYAGHQFYHLYDKNHWGHDRERATQLGNSLSDTYTELDSALSSLLDGAINNATVFIISVHGIETNHSGNHLMPMVLEKLGYQLPPDSGENEKNSSSILDLTRSFREILPQSVREFINENIIPQSYHDKVYLRQLSNSLDWRRSKAFFLPSDHFQGFISINLKGREPFGTVELGNEYEEICSQLSYDLSQLINPKTGKPAIRNLVRPSMIYRGENIYDLPDIVIQWAEDGPINHLYHPNFGNISDQNFTLRRSQHSSDGFMIAAGKHINRAARINGATTMDIAPTILYLMGETIPKDLDGNVLLELIDDDFKRDNRLNYGERSLITPEEMRL